MHTSIWWLMKKLEGAHGDFCNDLLISTRDRAEAEIEDNGEVNIA